MDLPNTDRSSKHDPPTRPEPRLPYGMLAFGAALGSLLACYGPIFVETFLGIPGLVPDPHVQAVVMWGFGLVAVFALARERVRHGRSHPLVVAAAAVAVLAGSLYVAYDQRIEILAYVLLFIGALLNQRATIAALNEDLRRQARQIAEFNRTLEAEVERQVGEIGRLNRLRSFLPPSVAEMVVAEEGGRRLESHRQYIACLVCDIRGFTAFSEGAEPEETIELLRDYHRGLDNLVTQHGGTIGSRTGDGLMVILNDPLPVDRPVLEAVRLALAMRDEWPRVSRRWRRLGHPIGLGIGIASGYATLGLLGDEGRTDYTAVGGTVNLAARLCAEAVDGEVLLDRHAFRDAEDEVEAVECDARRLKGYAEPVACFRLIGLTAGAAQMPAGTG